MIHITDNAASKISSSMAKRGKGKGVRIGVKTTGCSGLAYVLEFVDQTSENQDAHPCGNYFVFINDKDKPYFEGMTVDYAKKGLNEGFEFINPNESNRCGCGASFNVA